MWFAVSNKVLLDIRVQVVQKVGKDEKIFFPNYFALLNEPLHLLVVLSLQNKFIPMKRWRSIFLLMMIIFAVGITNISAQCSICTKTAQQLGEGPAKSLNTGILYLMFTPLAIMGFIGFRWWKKEKEIMERENNIG